MQNSPSACGRAFCFYTVLTALICFLHFLTNGADHAGHPGIFPESVSDSSTGSIGLNWI